MGCLHLKQIPFLILLADQKFLLSVKQIEINAFENSIEQFKSKIK